MNTIDYIKCNLKKNPTILKKILSFDETPEIKLYTIRHFIQLYAIKKNKYKFINLSMIDYKTFDDLYNTLIHITKDDSNSKEISFSNLNFIEKESFLIDHNIKYEYFEDFLIAYPASFKETGLIGSPVWCISKDKKQWENYNHDKSHFIIFNKNNTIGISSSEDGFKAYNFKNENIHNLKDKIGDNLFCHLKLTTIDTKESNLFFDFSLAVFFLTS